MRKIGKNGVLLGLLALGVYGAVANGIDITEPAFKRPPHIVFLVTEDPLNYNAHVTIPEFAGWLEKQFGYKTSILRGRGSQVSCSFPGIEKLSDADLLVVFCRRVALPPAELNIIKAYLKKGKPVVGIRTANHAFSLLETPAPGFEAWPEFVETVLGCKNRGYGPVEPGTDISVAPGATDHPILKKVATDHWHSNGNVYLVAPLLDSNAQVLLTGNGGGDVQPVAWVRHYGNSRIFYTSMGYPDDFSLPSFRQLLLNGIRWAAGLRQ